MQVKNKHNLTFNVIITETEKYVTYNHKDSNNNHVELRFSGKQELETIFGKSFQDIDQYDINAYVENGFKFYTEKQIEKEIENIYKKYEYVDVSFIKEEEIENLKTIVNKLNKPLDFEI